MAGASANNVLYFAPHRMDNGGTGAEIDFRFKLHFGGYEGEFIGDAAKARDAWSYAKSINARNGTWDGKMSDAFGSTPWSNVSASFRDSLFNYCTAYSVP